MQYKTLSNITHQPALREAQSNTTPFFSKVGFKKFVLVCKTAICAQVLFYTHLTDKSHKALVACSSSYRQY